MQAAALPDYQCNLGDGLILRWSSAEDMEKIAQLVGAAFRRKADDAPDTYLQACVRQFMRGDPIH